jgi:hypothetical protein
VGCIVALFLLASVTLFYVRARAEPDLGGEKYSKNNVDAKQGISEDRAELPNNQCQ